jgi:WD40 repeat protein
MHTSAIESLAVDGTGRLLATASADKTIRLWDTATGEMRSILRPPIADGDEGRLYACALSRDGKVLAAGGNTGSAWDGSWCIYLFEVASGRLLRRVAGLPGVIRDLAYAEDGRLAVCLDRGGLRVFRPDGEEAFRDTDYAGAGTTCHFDRTGRLAASSRDGYLRLYDRAGRLQAKVMTEGEPATVRFAPDGASLAVAYGAVTKIEVRSGLDVAADLFKKGRITVSGLDAYLGDRVPTLTGGRQTPTVIKPAAVPDFPLALLR